MRLKLLTISLALMVFGGAVCAAGPSRSALRKGMQGGAAYLTGRVDNTGSLQAVNYRQRDDGAEATAGLALYLAGYRPEKTAALQRLMDRLAKHASGNPYARATALLLWIESGRVADIKSDLDWLVEHQGDDGGWGAEPKQSSNIVDTAFVLFSLRAAARDGRGIPNDVWNDARRFLLACRNGDGGFGDQAVDAKPFRLRGSSNALSTAAGTASAGVLWEITKNPEDAKVFLQGYNWLSQRGRLDSVPQWHWGDPPLMTYLHLLTVATDFGTPLQLGKLNLEDQLGGVILGRQDPKGHFRPSGTAEDIPVTTGMAMLILERLQRPVVLLHWGLSGAEASGLAGDISRSMPQKGDWRPLTADIPIPAVQEAQLLCLAGPKPTKPIEPVVTQAIKQRQKVLIVGDEAFISNATKWLSKSLGVQPKPLTSQNPLLDEVKDEVSSAMTLRNSGEIVTLLLTVKKPAGAKVYAQGAAFLLGKSSGSPSPGDFTSEGSLDLGWVSHKGDWQVNNNAVSLLSPLLTAAVSRGLKVHTVFPEKPITPSPLLLWMTGTTLPDLSDTAEKSVRDYLRSGGMLVIDPAEGGKAAFDQGKAILESLYGVGSVRPLAEDSPLLTGKFGGGIGNDIRRLGLNEAGEKLAQPALWGVVHQGRVVAVLSRYALAGTVCKNLPASAPGFKLPDAQRLALNLILYAYAARNDYAADAP